MSSLEVQDMTCLALLYDGDAKAVNSRVFLQEISSRMKIKA